jgi:cell division protein FtsI/penicillin-binding protein 2
VPAVDLSRIDVGEYYASAPSPDGTAELTLDIGLQRAAERLLRRARPLQAAAVMIDFRTGKVIAWAESRRKAQKSLLTHPIAPAASLFKIVTTAALFQRTRLSHESQVCTAGGEHGIYARHLKPASGAEAHCAPLSEALGHSRNAAYAQLAHRHLNQEALLETAERIGFNHRLPFDADIPFGTLRLPSDELEFARAAAGFTGSHLTPLGAAYVSLLVANQGRGVNLHIVEHVGSYRAPRLRQDLGQVFSVNTAWRLTRMMEVTVHGGTSLGAFSDDQGKNYLGNVRVAGKTGTLQPSQSGPTTSWFSGFAPSREPRVIVSVLLQNGKVWHQKANEVARDLLRQYFVDRGHRGIDAP